MRKTTRPFVVETRRTRTPRPASNSIWDTAVLVDASRVGPSSGHDARIDRAFGDSLAAQQRAENRASPAEPSAPRRILPNLHSRPYDPVEERMQQDERERADKRQRSAIERRERAEEAQPAEPRQDKLPAPSAELPVTTVLATGEGSVEIAPGVSHEQRKTAWRRRSSNLRPGERWMRRLRYLR